MKKLFLTLFIAISFKCSAIIFWQPYPIVASVGASGTFQRVECSVYDSILGSWQYYISPYFNDSIKILSNNPGIIAFVTIPYNSTSGIQDSTYGFLCYDRVLHQFKPVIKYNHAPGMSNAVWISTLNDIVTIHRDYCCDYYGNPISTTDSYIYDIIQHDWKEGGGNTAFSIEGGYCSISGQRGGLYETYYNDDSWDPTYGRGMYSPYLKIFTGIGYGVSYFAYGNQDLFYNQNWNNESYCAAFDPLLPSGLWQYCKYDFVSDMMGNNSVFFKNNGYEFEIGIYDDSLHLWMVDTFYTEPNYQFSIVKDRVVAYAKNDKSKVYYQVYNPILHSWIKDSTSVNGLNSLSISDGTVYWTDSSGVSDFRGFNINSGWGNYTTDVFLYFHLTDFYSHMGYPLVYVRDYSIGTKDTWYTFSDGSATGVAEQNSLWHLFQNNGTYSSSGITGEVCIHANTANGVQTWCDDYQPPCTFSITSKNTCSGICNGEIQLSAITATQPFTYQLTDNSGTQYNLTSLCIGDYNLSLTDSSGCNVNAVVSIKEMNGLVKGSNKCAGLCNGIMEMEVSNGSFPISYLWSTGDTTNTIDSLCNVVFTVTVTDGNQCVVTVTDSVIDKNPIPVLSSNVVSSCIYNNNYIYYELGNPGYPYIISFPSGVYSDTSINSSGHLELLMLPQDTGAYTTVFTDPDGCVTNLTANILQPPAVTLSSTVQHPTCNCPNGIIFLNISGGTPPFTISCMPQTPGLSIGSSAIFNVYPGIYTIYLNDQNDCSDNNKDTLLVTVGMDEQHISGISVSPNPADGYIYIRNERSLIISGTLLSSVGQIVKSFNITDATFKQWEISDLANGIYTLYIYHESLTRRFKLIVSH